jgi:hypothetical protein
MKLMNMVIAVALTAVATQFAVGQEQPLTDSSQEHQRRDQLRAAVQEICPVSGGKLGSMGEPIKVQVGQESVFLCCKGCVNQQIKPEHWATIHANYAKAQRICPVMKKDLPKNPKWTFVEGQIVYICCPGCDKKIAADQQTYLRAIDELYVAALDAKNLAR